MIRLTLPFVWGTTSGTVVAVLLKTVLKMLSILIDGWTVSGGWTGRQMTTLTAASAFAVCRPAR